jgi:hypothetical protein
MLPEVKFTRTLQNSIREFFVKYNELQGRRFYPIRFASAGRAVAMVRSA